MAVFAGEPHSIVCLCPYRTGCCGTTTSTISIFGIKTLRPVHPPDHSFRVLLILTSHHRLDILDFLVGIGRILMRFGGRFRDVLERAANARTLIDPVDSVFELSC